MFFNFHEFPLAGHNDLITKKTLVLFSLAFFFAISISITSAEAAIFMKIEGIDGDATIDIPACNRKCIELGSLQWGEQRSISTGGSGSPREASAPSLSEIVVTKTMDKSSVPIFVEALGGKGKQIDIFLVQPGASKPQTYAQYRLQNALISGYSISSGGDRPSESISFNYQKLETIVTPFDSEGIPGTPSSFCWDLTKSRSCPTSGFTDGMTSGNIIGEGDKNITIEDHTDPTKGFLITADALGGPNPAQLSLCSGSALVTMHAGGQIAVTCGSITIEVVSGSVQVDFVALDGTTGTTTLVAGNSVTFDAATLFITNNGSVPVVVTVDGEDITIDPGETTVLDVSDPVVTAPADIVAEATGPAGAMVSYPLPTATDNTGVVDGPTCTPASGSTFELGITTVECTAADAAGNIGMASFTVTVVDTTPPTLTVPDSVSSDATGPAGASVSYSATASDLVDGTVTPTCAPASGSIFALGPTPVECTAIDAAGNPSSASFTVNVQLCGMSADSFNLIVGTDGKDKIKGTDGPDAIFGLGGNDNIKAGKGNDCVNGGDGKDNINGGEGNDAINGGNGDDKIKGRNGNDMISGGDGNDMIFGGNGEDNINGGAGNDRISGGPDADTISGGDGNDIINGKQGNNILNGDAGDDRLRGGKGNELIDGGSGVNMCFGGGGVDTILNCANAVAAAIPEMEEEDNDD